MCDLLNQAGDFLSRAEPDKVIVLGGAFGVAALGIVCGTIKNIARHKQREQSRREIAAYVAEGSITPEDGAKLIAAGKKTDWCG